MRTKELAGLLPLIAITLLFTRPAHAKDQPCANAPSENAAVVKTMRTMYAVASKDDYDLFNKVIASDFYAFDGGHQYPGDTILDYVKQLQQQGYVFVWTVNDPQVHIACHSKPEVAWITYTNRGSIKDPSGVTTPMQWLESAVLEKQDNRWRIRFFHSTRVPAPPPPQK
jgi:ketosteroid isomerase-like protein